MNSGLNCCEREEEILDAAAAGVWSEELRAHVSSCEACREALAVTGALREPLALLSTLPSASFLWWKGQIQARRDAAERLERALAVAERAGVVGVLVALGLLGNWMVAGAALGIALPVAWYWPATWPVTGS